MVVGQYTVTKRLGSGAMGEVFLARDAALDRDVAVKRLLGDLDADTRRRFLREAQTVAKLRHPNIVSVHACGADEDGAPYMVMEYIPGPTFKQLIAAEPPLPIASALGYTAQLCAGLACAHEAGVIHRDIKPGNLMLDQGDRLRIVDFGVALVTDASHARASLVAGTLAYMSPEQANGAPVDGRSDIFSAGAVLYEMLARRKAFLRTGDSAAATLKRVVHDDPEPLRTLRPDLSPEIERIVMTALAKRPEARFADAAAMRLAVEAELARGDASVGATRPVPAMTPARRRYGTPIALAATLAVAVAAAGYLLSGPKQVAEAAGENAIQAADAQLSQPAPKARDLFYAPQAPPPGKPAPASAPARPAPSRGAVATRTGLMYRLQQQTRDGSWADVDPASTFHSGDKVRFGFQSNVAGYLYVLVKGSTGQWRQIFPDARIDNGSNTVRPFEDYLVPAQGSFTFDANPGEEQLFVYLSTTALTELPGYGAPAPAAAPIEQAAVTRLAGSVRARDLIFEAPATTSREPSGAPAKPEVIVVNTAGHGGPIVIALTLTHR
jgi:hypothetical protein